MKKDLYGTEIVLGAKIRLYPSTEKCYVTRIGETYTVIDLLIPKQFSNYYDYAENQIKIKSDVDGHEYHVYLTTVVVIIVDPVKFIDQLPI